MPMRFQLSFGSFDHSDEPLRSLCLRRFFGLPITL